MKSFPMPKHGLATGDIDLVRCKSHIKVLKWRERKRISARRELVVEAAANTLPTTNEIGNLRKKILRFLHEKGPYGSFIDRSG